MATERRRPGNTPKAADKPGVADDTPNDAAATDNSAAEGDQEAETGENQGGSVAEPDPEGDAGSPQPQTPATGAPSAPAANGQPVPKKHFESGRPSTKPEKVRASQRPYLDSPRPFGVHIDGLLHRFLKGRTLLKHLKPEQVAALKNDPYVSDNGAEVVTDED